MVLAADTRCDDSAEPLPTAFMVYATASRRVCAECAGMGRWHHISHGAYPWYIRGGAAGTGSVPAVASRQIVVRTNRCALNVGGEMVKSKRKKPRPARWTNL
jgi:hypothetical protein